MPALVPQRVTATVRRGAVRLVRLETEHETFLTTPEHPFATPSSGWIGAGRLVPGDWVVSERFGAIRLSSVRSEPASLPVPVFNLSVAASQAYFVGTDRVLVHNTTCKSNAFESREEAIERMTREREELDRRIEALKQEMPASPEIAALKTQRRKLGMRINFARAEQRKEQGVAAPSADERARVRGEADYKAAQKALEDAQKELAALESRPISEAERATFVARKAELVKQIASLKLIYDRTNQVLTLLRELAELGKDTPTTDAERGALEEKKRKVREDLNLERKRIAGLKHVRRKRADPEEREEIRKYNRDGRRRLHRPADHLADTERPRDRLELLEDELADLQQGAPSWSRDMRIHHLTARIETMRKLVEVRREHQKLKQRCWSGRRAREKQIAAGGNTRKLDEKLEQDELRLRSLKIERAKLRVGERLLAQLDETPWAHTPGPADEAQLREFERQLVEGLANDQQLADIERALDAMDPTDAGWEQAVLEEVQDVDETLREWEALLHQSPSPERAAGFQSSFERLQQELREERVAVEGAVFALANQHAFIEQTRAASSNGPTWQERLRAIHQEQLDLRADWRARLSARLDSARRRREDMRRVERFRDETTDAELAREIALLERELQNAG